MLLSLTLIPTVFLLLISLVNLALTSAHWFISDWQLIRWQYYVDPEFVSLKYLGRSAKEYTECALLPGFCPDQLVEFIQTPTDASIASATFGLFAVAVAFLALSKLKKGDMDLDVNKPRRRFWVGFATVAGLSVLAASLAAFVLHFTSFGSGKFQCDSSVLKDRNMNIWCTREAGTCNLMPDWMETRQEFLNTTSEIAAALVGWTLNETTKSEVDKVLREGQEELNTMKQRQAVACNATRAVKYMQVLLMIMSAAMVAMFNFQAIARKKTRYGRLTVGNIGKPYR